MRGTNRFKLKESSILLHAQPESESDLYRWAFPYVRVMVHLGSLGAQKKKAWYGRIFTRSPVLASCASLPSTSRLDYGDSKFVERNSGRNGYNCNIVTVSMT